MLSNRLPRNHLARRLASHGRHGRLGNAEVRRGVVRPPRTTRNRFELCWLRQMTIRTATKDSSVTDWVTTRTDLS